MRYRLRPWLPLDMYLAWGIKAALLCVLSLSTRHLHNPPSPLICFMLSGCDQLMSFFGLQLIMLMSPAQPKIRNCAPNPRRGIFSYISRLPLILILFFSNLSPSCCSYLLPSSLFPRSSFLNLLFHSALSRPSPVPTPSTSLHLLPLPCWGRRAATKLTSTLSTAPPQKCPLGWDQSAPGLTPA